MVFDLIIYACFINSRHFYVPEDEFYLNEQITHLFINIFIGHIKADMPSSFILIVLLFKQIW